MARINTNISSMIAQRNLGRAQIDLNRSLERLATGLRITRGADDPAGLITSERLRSEISGLHSAVGNSQRASSVMATTEAALSEVSDLLNSIKGLVIQAANTGGMSPEEIEANQLQLDSAIDSVTRISNTANFAGLQLLNGSLEYLTSGVTSSEIRNMKIFGANFGLNSSIPVTVDVLSSAQTAEIKLTASYGGTGNGTLISAVTIEISGNEGVQVLTFLSGTPMSAIINGVNTIKDSTGVSAIMASAASTSSGVIFTSLDFGSDSFVGIRRLGSSGEGFFDAQLSNQRDVGADVSAIVNGQMAVGDGLSLKISNPMLKLELLLDSSFAQQTVTDSTFSITGGGARYQVGAEVKVNQQINFGISSIAASRLGGVIVNDELQFLVSLKSGGTNELKNSGQLDNASKILGQAIDEVSMLRGQLGAIERNVLQTNIRSLQVAIENTTAAESKIRDADFAFETAQLTRAQILQGAGISVLSTANQSNSAILQLLG